MTFLNPIGFAGLLSLPVILIFHLLFRRKKRYVVSHLGLWSFLDARTTGPRARKIPLTWILLLDLLIATLISLAWARPSLTLAESEQRPRHMVILLDVSTSMRAGAGGSNTRFAEARAVVDALVQAAHEETLITVLSFGRHARVISDSRQAEGALEPGLLDQVRVGETGYALTEALALGQASLEPDLPAEFHAITDGNFPLADTDAIRGFAYPLRWHWVGQPADNQAVLELNATPQGANRYQVFARLANYGSAAVTREAVLTVEGREVNRVRIELPADSSVPQVWNISTGAQNPARSAVVSLTGSDALPEDDAAAIGLQASEMIRVALVADNLVPLQQSIQSVPDVDLRVIAPSDYDGTPAREKAAFDLTIFRNFLPAAWPDGHVLVVDPPAGNDLLQIRPVHEIAAGSPSHTSETNPLVAGIDFSGVRWARASTLAGSPPAGSQPAFTELLQAGGIPVLLQNELEQPSGKLTRVTLLLADLSAGNFTKHPAFPILMANLVNIARQAPVPPGFATGEALPLPAAGSYQAVQIKPPDLPPINMEGSWPDRFVDTTGAGLYHFEFTAVDGSLTEFTTAAQAGDAVESDLRPRAWNQLVAAQNSLAADHQPAPRKLDLSIWLLGAAVLLFLTEAVLAWRR